MRDEDVLELLRAARDPDPARVLEALVRASGADRGFLALGEGEGFSILTARNLEPEELERARERPSRTLLERALREGRPLSATDADLQGVASLREQKVLSVAVLPLRSCRGAVVLDSRRKGLFEDLERLDRLAGELDRALDRSGRGEIVGTSPPMRELQRVLDKVAAAPYPVLLCGESGTGKELAARAIHRRGPRARGPFVAANCAALPETLLESELFGHARGAFTGADRDHAGLFEQAHGGVLFLDEAACLSPGAQETLLRVLETGEVRRVGGSRAVRVDVRVVAATNRDLGSQEGFRRDLFYRLDVLRVNLPPLRERMEDLPLLARHFLARAARETGTPPRRLTPAALAVLAGHSWPGNVRELENALRRAAALSESDVLDAADFAFLRRVPAPSGGEDSILPVDEYIRSTAERWEGRLPLSEIAARLGVSRKTLWMKRKGARA